MLSLGKLKADVVMENEPEMDYWRKCKCSSLCLMLLYLKLEVGFPCCSMLIDVGGLVLGFFFSNMVHSLMAIILVADYAYLSGLSIFAFRLTLVLLPKPYSV